MPCGKSRTFAVLAGSAVWLVALGWLDRNTGYELGLFAFYTAPVAVVAWHLGQRPGIAVAFIAALIWYVADRASGDHYSVPFYGYWNTGMHFTSFLVNAFAFAKIKADLDQRHELERALKENQKEMRQLSWLVYPCSRCRKAHVPGFIRATVQERLKAMPPETLCDDCRNAEATAPKDKLYEHV